MRLSDESVSFHRWKLAMDKLAIGSGRIEIMIDKRQIFICVVGGYQEPRNASVLETVLQSYETLHRGQGKKCTRVMYDVSA